MSPAMKPLIAALVNLGDRAESAIEQVERLGGDVVPYKSVRGLREAVEMVHCLRRLVQKSQIDAVDVHGAFGAPGDFGYESEIGKALAKVYGGGGAK